MSSTNLEDFTRWTLLPDHQRGGFSGYGSNGEALLRPAGRGRTGCRVTWSPVPGYRVEGRGPLHGQAVHKGRAYGQPLRVRAHREGPSRSEPTGARDYLDPVAVLPGYRDGRRGSVHRSAEHPGDRREIPYRCRVYAPGHWASHSESCTRTPGYPPRSLLDLHVPNGIEDAPVVIWGQRAAGYMTPPPEGPAGSCPTTFPPPTLVWGRLAAAGIRVARA